MSDDHEKIRAQRKKFDADLPELLKMHAGKWVCYLDGVQWISASMNEAYEKGLTRYGIDGRFLIAQVIEHEPIPAWKLGGLGATAIYEQIHEELKAENARLRTVADAALAAYKSPGYPEHAKLFEALVAAGYTNER